MEAKKNMEEWCMPADIDDGETRLRFVCKRCPEESQCSANAWKNGKAWSYVGDYEVRQYVVRHLTASSKHEVPLAKAQDLAFDAAVEVEEDTFADREMLRAEPTPPKQAAPPATAPPGYADRRNVSGGDGRQPQSPPGKRPRFDRGGPWQDRGGSGDPWQDRGSSGSGGSGAAWQDRGSSRSGGGSGGGGGGGGGGSSTDTSGLLQVARAMQESVQVLGDALVQQRQAAPAAPKPEVLTLSKGGDGVLTVAAETVQVPLSSLRLMHSSVRSVRKSAEEMAVMIPVLSAAERALMQFIAN